MFVRLNLTLKIMSLMSLFHENVYLIFKNPTGSGFFVYYTVLIS